MQECDLTLLSCPSDCEVSTNTIYAILEQNCKYQLSEGHHPLCTKEWIQQQAPLLPPVLQAFRSTMSDSPPASLPLPSPSPTSMERARHDSGINMQLSRETDAEEKEDLTVSVLLQTRVTEIICQFNRAVQAKDEEIAALRVQVAELERQLYVKSAKLKEHDSRLLILSVNNASCDGSCIWKITQFSKRKVAATAKGGKYTSESMLSQPFYSGRHGYKMCLRLYIVGDGIGKGTHLSLFFVVMCGGFYNILQWPFTHRITFKLINQAGGDDIDYAFRPDPQSSSFRKPESDMNIASGCPIFVSHTELERGGFIVDDAIFIKCIVDTNTIRVRSQ